MTFEGLLPLYFLTFLTSDVLALIKCFNGCKSGKTFNVGGEWLYGILWAMEGCDLEGFYTLQFNLDRKVDNITKGKLRLRTRLVGNARGQTLMNLTMVNSVS